MEKSCSFTTRPHRGIFPQQQRTIDHVVDDIVSKNPENLSQIVLFGSCARNSARYDSDVDILLVYSEFNERWHDGFLALKNSLWNPGDVDVDIHAMTEDRYRMGVDLFAQNVRRDGKVLWQR